MLPCKLTIGFASTARERETDAGCYSRASLRRRANWRCGVLTEPISNKSGRDGRLGGQGRIGIGEFRGNAGDVRALCSRDRQFVGGRLAWFVLGGRDTLRL